MSKKLMNLLLAHAALCGYAMGNKDYDVSVSNFGGKGKSPFDAQKCKPKELHEFTIKGTKIMATSRKDAIKKYNRLKKK